MLEGADEVCHAILGSKASRVWKDWKEEGLGRDDEMCRCSRVLLAFVVLL
jgi:hypothetical protein